MGVLRGMVAQMVADETAALRAQVSPKRLVIKSPWSYMPAVSSTQPAFTRPGVVYRAACVVCLLGQVRALEDQLVALRRARGAA
eukprot:COSAG01_NODE_33_length_35013_cov_86.824144_21_plen_84_part_00